MTVLDLCYWFFLYYLSLLVVRLNYGLEHPGAGARVIFLSFHSSGLCVA